MGNRGERGINASRPGTVFLSRGNGNTSAARAVIKKFPRASEERSPLKRVRNDIQISGKFLDGRKLDSKVYIALVRKVGIFNYEKDPGSASTFLRGVTVENKGAWAKQRDKEKSRARIHGNKFRAGCLPTCSFNQLRIVIGRNTLNLSAI